MRFLLGLTLTLIALTCNAQSPIDVVRSRCIDGICKVKASAPDHFKGGTGCLIAPTWVLTVDHVVEEYPAVVQFRNEQVQVVGRWRDQFADCAVLKLAHVPRTGKVMPVARTEGSGVVCCVGFDNGDTSQLRLFEGVAQTNGANELRIRPYNARMAEHGNSGGPVFNARGEVISSLHSNSELGNTYANSNAQLHRFIERIRQRTGEQIINWASMSPNQYGGGFQTMPAIGGSIQSNCPNGQCPLPSQPTVMPIQGQPLTLNPPLQSTPSLQGPATPVIPISPSMPIVPPTNQTIPTPIQGRFMLYLYPGQ